MPACAHLHRRECDCLADSALRFAAAHLDGEMHRDGKPAIEHAKRVAAGFGYDPELFAIAVLHDVLEDCPDVTYWNIRWRFGYRVGEGVDAMSQRKGEGYHAYIRRLRKNPDAVQVKIADIEDNMARADDQAKRKFELYQWALNLLRWP